MLSWFQSEMNGFRERKVMKASISCLFFLLFFLQQGCKEDRTQTNLQYMPDMADGPVSKPYRSYIEPPEGSIAYKAELYEVTAEKAGEVMVNPLKADLKKRAENLAKGKEIYGIYCTPCHGPKAKGNGSIVGRDNYPKPPDLTFGDRYKKEGDGYFYHTIVFGADGVPGVDPKYKKNGIMPGYGHSITSKKERWQVVMYIRQLQGLYSDESK